MGLEIVEIIMDLEDTFGVKLELDQRLRTVGGLQDAVAAALARVHTQDRETLRLRLEADIGAALGISGADLNRPILAVVPDLPKRLPDLALATWWDLPYRMRRAKWLVAVLWGITPLGVLALALASPRDRTVAIVAVVFGPMLVAVLAYLTDGWRPRLPDLGDATAQGLVDRAVELFLKRDPEATVRWLHGGIVERGAIDSKVIAILANRSGRKPETISPTDRLVDDLGLG